jgi:hypothetical protein
VRESERERERDRVRESESDREREIYRERLSEIDRQRDSVCVCGPRRKQRRPPRAGTWRVESIGSSDKDGRFLPDD